MRVEFEASRCSTISRVELVHNLMIALFSLQGQASDLDPKYRDEVANNLQRLIDDLCNENHTLVIPTPNQKVRFQ